MNRRQLILTSASLAGVAAAQVARAAKPCPPPQITLAGGTSAATSCGGGAFTYSTNFASDENVLSQGGKFLKRGNSWQNVKVAGGKAFSTDIQLAYDDAYSIYNQAGYPANQRAWAVIHRDANYNAGTTHEVELLLRCSDTASTIQWYECLWNVTGGVQCVRFDNKTMGNFTDLPLAEFHNIVPKHNDRYEATISGSTITATVNGALLFRCIDSTIGAGAPGLAFFLRSGARNTALCFKEWGCSPL